MMTVIMSSCHPCQHGDSSDSTCLIVITMDLIMLIDVVGVVFVIAVIVDMVVEVACAPGAIR